MDCHHPWDHGLDADCQLLCRRRGSGRLLFEFMLLLRERLERRKQELSQWSSAVV